MAGKETEAGSARELCPLGRFLRRLEEVSGNAPEFREHLGRSRLELLKAARSLLDSKIKALEKKTTPGKKKVARKITIE